MLLQHADGLAQFLIVFVNVGQDAKFHELLLCHSPDAGSGRSTRSFPISVHAEADAETYMFSTFFRLHVVTASRARTPWYLVPTAPTDTTFYPTIGALVIGDIACRI